MAEPTLRCAAQYLRMSTEQQTYSLEYQQAAIAAYAHAQGYESCGPTPTPASAASP